MVRCGTCGQELPDDPNEADEIVDCRYCEAIFCSAECASDHEDQMHPDEAVPAAEDEDERR